VVLVDLGPLGDAGARLQNVVEQPTEGSHEI
jgi:hypothetical protein